MKSSQRGDAKIIILIILLALIAIGYYLFLPQYKINRRSSLENKIFALQGTVSQCKVNSDCIPTKISTLACGFMIVNKNANQTDINTLSSLTQEYTDLGYVSGAGACIQTTDKIGCLNSRCQYISRTD